MGPLFELITVVVLAGGGMTPPQITLQPTLSECWKAANAYVHQDPSKLGGVGIGAGCVVRVQRELKS